MSKLIAPTKMQRDGTHLSPIHFESGYMPILWTTKEIITTGNARDIKLSTLMSFMALKLNNKNTDIDPRMPDHEMRNAFFQLTTFLHPLKICIVLDTTRKRITIVAMNMTTANPQWADVK